MSDNIIPGLSIRGSVSTPSSPGYDQAISRPSATCVLHPAYVVCSQISSDVLQILHFARSHDPPLKVAVKGGASNLLPGLSSCDGGIIIDLARLNHVKVAHQENSKIHFKHFAAFANLSKVAKDPKVNGLCKKRYHIFCYLYKAVKGALGSFQSTQTYQTTLERHQNPFINT
ncbi:hypothetical protein JOM56_014545 [Amanita muscaria]